MAGREYKLLPSSNKLQEATSHIHSLINGDPRRESAHLQLQPPELKKVKKQTQDAPNLARKD
jgi:hypothetical protein